MNRTFEVTTARGRKVSVVEIQRWIDTSDKTGSSRTPGQKKLRLADGRAIAFDGDRFSLPDGDSFGLGDIPE